MENDLADLSLEDGDEEFMAMMSTMTNLWHPLRVVQISDLRGKIFLFRFFHKIDIEWVVNGAPWTFNNHLLVFHCLKDGEDLMKISLVLSTFWVQIHELPPGLFSESIAKTFRYGEGILIRGKERVRDEMGSYFRVKPRRGFEESLIESGDVKKRPKKDIRNHNVSRVIDSLVVKEEDHEGVYLWLGRVVINLKSFSRNYVVIKIQEIEDSKQMRFTSFYGAPNARS
ncbi:hypothetical protein Gotri_018892, partial [Gossypium trilobum]|nr:hypothetical protein [Gossypium trilobum]